MSIRHRDTCSAGRIVGGWAIERSRQGTERNNAGRWWLVVGAISVVALAIRVAFVLHYLNPSPLAGDAAYYQQVANLVARGHGFVDPYRGAADATHPPLYSLALALVSTFGLRTVLDHQLWSCVLGAAMVPVIALTGRELIDDRTGLIAGALAAIFPDFWINDGLLMSETLLQLVVAALVLFVYRMIRRPSIGNAAAVGAMCGLAALTRGELALLPVVLVVPLVWSLYRHLGRPALRLGVVTLAVMVVVMTPWFVYNLGRFEHPVIVSTQGGQTLAGANCPYTYTEPLVGLWTYPCVLFNRPGTRVGQPAHGKDASVTDGLYRDNAIDFAKSQMSRVPVVVGARFGRVLGLYRPHQQLSAESGGADGRPYGPALAGLVIYYLAIVAAVFGVLRFRRRRIPVWPVLSLGVLVVVTAMLTYGASRFRVPLEVALMVPAAAGIGRGVKWASTRKDSWRSWRNARSSVW